jgi:lipopolysaccharide transport system permease protein
VASGVSPAPDRMIALVRTLFRYRALIESLVSRELKARYRGSVLGFLWSFVNPLLLLLTYTLAFTVILRVPQTERMSPYYLFFFCGLLPWIWFSSSLAESAGVLIAGGNLIKKVLFPAEILPTVTVLANLAHFLLGLPILLGCLAWEGRLSPTLLLLPLPIFVQLVLTLGCAYFLSALTVHFRDMGNILGHILQLWFFATPIIYDVDLLGHGTLRQLERLNPMGHIIISYQQMMLFGHFDHWRGLTAALAAGILAFVFGGFVFDRLRDTLSESV